MISYTRFDIVDGFDFGGSSVDDVLIMVVDGYKGDIIIC